MSSSTQTARRGGRAAGQARAARSSKFADDSVLAPDEAPEVRELRKKYPQKLAQLKELFSDWADEDLLLSIQEANGDVEVAIGRIMDGHVMRWDSVSKPKKTKPAAPVGSAPTNALPRASAGPSRGASASAGRGDSRGARGGRGGVRGGRGGARGAAVSRVNGHAPTSEAATTSSSTPAAWSESKPAEPEAAPEAPTVEEPVVEAPPAVEEKPKAAVNGASSKRSWAQIAKPKSPPPPPPPAAAAPAAAPEPAPVGAPEPAAVPEKSAEAPAPAPTSWAARASAAQQQPKQEPSDKALGVGEAWADSVVASHTDEKPKYADAETADISAHLPPNDTNAAGPLDVGPEATTATTLDVGAPQVPQDEVEPQVAIAAPQQGAGPPGLTKRTGSARPQQQEAVVMPTQAAPGLSQVGVQFGSLSLDDPSSAQPEPTPARQDVAIDATPAQDPQQPQQPQQYQQQVPPQLAGYPYQQQYGYYPQADESKTKQQSQYGDQYANRFPSQYSAFDSSSSYYNKPVETAPSSYYQQPAAAFSAAPPPPPQQAQPTSVSPAPLAQPQQQQQQQQQSYGSFGASSNYPSSAQTDFSALYSQDALRSAAFYDQYQQPFQRDDKSALAQSTQPQQQPQAQGQQGQQAQQGQPQQQQQQPYPGMMPYGYPYGYYPAYNQYQPSSYGQYGPPSYYQYPTAPMGGRAPQGAPQQQQPGAQTQPQAQQQQQQQPQQPQQQQQSASAGAYGQLYRQGAYGGYGFNQGAPKEQQPQQQQQQQYGNKDLDRFF